MALDAHREASPLDWHWGVSNAGPGKLSVWLEPWAEEFDIPVRSSLTLRIVNSQPIANPLEIENTEDGIVIWANGGDRIEGYLGGLLQDTASAKIEAPNPVGISPKEFLSIAFTDQPSARLGGRPDNGASPPISWWSKLKAAFGTNAS